MVADAVEEPPKKCERYTPVNLSDLIRAVEGGANYDDKYWSCIERMSYYVSGREQEVHVQSL